MGRVRAAAANGAGAGNGGEMRMRRQDNSATYVESVRYAASPQGSLEKSFGVNKITTPPRGSGDESVEKKGDIELFKGGTGNHAPSGGEPLG